MTSQAYRHHQPPHQPAKLLFKKEYLYKVVLILVITTDRIVITLLRAPGAEDVHPGLIGWKKKNNEKKGHLDKAKIEVYICTRTPLGVLVFVVSRFLWARLLDTTISCIFFNYDCHVATDSNLCDRSYV